MWTCSCLQQADALSKVMRLVVIRICCLGHQHVRGTTTWLRLPPHPKYTKSPPPSPQQEGRCIPHHVPGHDGHGPAVLGHGACLKQCKDVVHNASHTQGHVA